MRDGLLYAFAALGVVTAARWIFVRVLRWFMRRPAIYRRRQRALCRAAIKTASDPAFHEALQRYARDLAEDLEAAVSSSGETLSPLLRCT
jgi:hypothetical protein